MLGALVTAAVALAIGWASVAPMTAFRAGDAVVRVSWGARPERVETCRTVSGEELAKLAPQMRQRVVCEGTTARYRLEVRRDGVLIASMDVRGGGLRHDRDLYVFREIPVYPGPSTIAVRFARLDSVPAERETGLERTDTVEAATRRSRADSAGAARGGIAPDRAIRETDERLRRRAEAVPPLLALDTTVTLGEREVLLVTYDPERRRLAAVRCAP